MRVHEWHRPFTLVSCFEPSLSWSAFIYFFLKCLIVHFISLFPEHYIYCLDRSDYWPHFRKPVATALHFNDRRVLNNQIDIGKKAFGNIDRFSAPVLEWPCLLNATHSDTSLQFFSRAAAFASRDGVSHTSGPNALCCCRACTLSRRNVALCQSFALFLAVLLSMSSYCISLPILLRRARKRARESHVQPRTKESAGSMHTFNRYSCLHKHSRKIIQVHCAGISEDIYIYYIGVCKRALKIGNNNRAHSDNFWFFARKLGK